MSRCSWQINNFFNKIKNISQLVSNCWLYYDSRYLIWTPFCPSSARFGFDIAQNEPCEVCRSPEPPLSTLRVPLTLSSGDARNQQQALRPGSIASHRATSAGSDVLASCRSPGARSAKARSTSHSGSYYRRRPSKVTFFPVDSYIFS